MPTIEGFKLGELLYAGLHTMVYRGEREAAAGQLLIKVPRSNDRYEDLARFRHESELILSLADNGSLPAHQLAGSANNVFLICLDPGGEALASLTKEGPPDLDTFFWIAIGLAEQVQKIHDQQIIHKDLNPHNLLVDLDNRSVDLLTLSIATRLRREDKKLLSPQMLEGLPQYISPEQTGRMNRAVDYRTDLYSLGVIYYELLTGRRPFEAEDLMELIHAQIAVTPPTPTELEPAVPEVLSNLVMKLMAKNAEDRYHSCHGVAHDLRECQRRYQETGTVDEFAIAREDIAGGLLIPQKLYGRDPEIRTLMAAFDRVSLGPSELMLVAGYSGIGKSALIREIHKPIVAKRGYFISGKFELHKQNIPYFAFAQAFRDLIRQLLTEGADELARWKSDLLEAFGANGQVLIDIIPEIEHIVGPQQAVPELGPQESEIRFRAVFQSFIRVFTRREHPLAFFVDDLQWADTASLALIQFLIGNPENRFLFLIGAYRDNEVNDAHPLTLAVEEIEKQKATLSRITLQPLKLADVQQLVTDTFRCEPEAARSLAGLLHEKTGGNPFFLTQFLHSLHEETLIVYEVEAGGWAWDIARIERKESTENVIDLMVKRLRRLTDATRDALTLASCVGSEFDLRTLSHVTASSSEDMAASLWEAARIGMITPLDDSYKLVKGWRAQSGSLADSGLWTDHGLPAGTDSPAGGNGDSGLDVDTGAFVVSYKFLHDRIQQAAHSLLSEDNQKAVHLELGRFLLDDTTEHSDLEERVFEIVNHFNTCVELIDEPAERRRIAELNLLAGHRARDSTAYRVAQRYLGIGMSLLPADAWTHDYDLAMNLYSLGSESDYLVGDFEKAEAGFDVTLDNAQSLHEKGDIYTLKAVLARHATRYDDALDVHIEGLRRFGIEMPDYRTEPERFASIIDADVAELKATLEGRDIDSLADLPEMTDPDQLAMTNMLEDLIILGYFYSRTMPQFAALKILKTVLEYGNCSASPLAFTMYGMMLGSEFDDFKTGHRFGKMGFALAKKQGNTSAVAKAGFFLGFVLNHWREHVRDCLPILKEAYLAGLASGHLSYSGMVAFFMGCYTTFKDADLPEIIKCFNTYFDIMEPQSRIAAEAYHDMALRLAGDPVAHERATHLKGNYMERITAPGMELALQHYYNVRMIYFYHLEDYDSAAEELKKADEIGRIEDILYNQFAPTERFFYSALLFAARHDDAPEEEQPDLLAGLRRYRDVMRQFARDCRDNFQMKDHLLSAEVARITGDTVAAMEHYDLAIDTARQYEFVKIEALARELAARFYLGLGRRRIASRYLREACRGYGRWGAKAKLDSLEQTYPELLELDDATVEISIDETGPRSLDPQSIDLQTVLESSQAISGEIVLAKFLERMMRLCMQNAGAQKGLLLVERDGELWIEASATGEEIEVRQSLPVAGSNQLPLSIIQYVERTGESVILGDAFNSGLFQNDPYIREHRVKSALCLPSVRQAGRLAVIYLENALTADAFPPERVQILQMISTQAAISLENAVLYDTLEQKVEARTRELIAKNSELETTLRRLQEARDRMIVQDRLASLGSLAAGIAHEIKNPLNFVNNFADLSVELLSELGEEITDAKLDEEAASYIGEILGDIKVNMETINKHGKQADGIIKSMLEHSRSSAGERQDCDLNKLVEEYVTLAFHGLRSQDPSFTVDLDLDLDQGLDTIWGTPQELGRVVLNLIHNGCHAAFAKKKQLGDTFSPMVRVTTRELDDTVEIRVRDNGMGVPEGIRDKIFNPFFTTKAAGEGTGLGLSLSHDIVVQGYAGDLRCESEEGESAEFTVVLPRGDQPSR